MTKELDLDKVPQDVRDLLFTDWDMSRAFEETIKKLDKIRDEMKRHRIEIGKLPPEKQVIYWEAISQHYKEIFGD